MTKQPGSKAPYFPHVIQISARHWQSLELGTLSRLISERRIPAIIFYRQLALKLNRQHPPGAQAVHAGHLNLYATLQKCYRHLLDVVAEDKSPGLLVQALRHGGIEPDAVAVRQLMAGMVEQFPPQAVLTGSEDAAGWLAAATWADERRRIVLREALLLRLAAENSALSPFREILDDSELAAVCGEYPRLVAAMTSVLAQGPLLDEVGMTLIEALRAPLKASPDDLAGQVGFIREHWNLLLPAELLEELDIAFDILLEEERERGWGGEPGPPPVLEFGWGRGGHGGGHGTAHDGSSVFGGYDYPEYENFSSDADWMSNVVLLAKMVYVWLDQLSRQHGQQISRLDQIPDAELQRLATAGFSGLWLIGIWERSPASQRIKQLCGNPDAIASAYSLYDYEIAADLGGWPALANLRERAFAHGIRLASDMVPNHTGIHSRWVLQHPDWFVQTDYPPFPTYQFNGEDLSHSPDAVIQIEDGYWTKTEAAVVFRYIERSTGRTRYIYHGNDGTSIPWNDTAQLNYLLPEVREAVIQTILHVARNFPIIRFDAAMTLAKKHYQRLWFPIRGLGGGIPSRAGHGMNRDEFDAVFPVEFWREVVDRVAAEAPDTLLLAEAFWMMEGYFVRTLGMHRVYNSAFMNMLKMEENTKYRQTIKNVLEFNPEVLKRFVNFMNNPDEKTAVEQFGSQGKYFGACVLMVTMPGLPMFGHGQIEGFREKYGMEYKRAYWDEQVDEGMVRAHELWIFPLLRRRWLFSGSENFVLFDFYAGSAVDENVFAYSNRVADQRALVLYHNRYAATAGWIRESAAFAVNGGGSEPELRRTTLGEALGIASEDGIYYAFRDAVSGLEYLRKGRELCDKGLYAELSEYEFHVFVDFREIGDDDQGSWAGLCAALNGRGVESLVDERRQVRYASLNAAFRSALGQMPEQPGTVLADALGTDQPLSHDCRRFLAILNSQTGAKTADSAAKLEGLTRSLALMSSLPKLKLSVKESRQLLAVLQSLLETVPGMRLLLAWLLLHDAGSETFDRFGLDYSLGYCQLPDGQIRIDRYGAMLLRALLELAGRGSDPESLPVAEAFGLPACSAFMAVHESEAVFWFNKERFEQLLQWCLLTRLAEFAAGRPATREISTWFGKAARELQRLTDMAAHAGYRLKLFMGLMAPPQGSVAAGVKKAVKKGEARKKSDAKRVAGTHTTETPDDSLPG